MKRAMAAAMSLRIGVRDDVDAAALGSKSAISAGQSTAGSECSNKPTMGSTSTSQRGFAWRTSGSIWCPRPRPNTTRKVGLSRGCVERVSWPAASRRSLSAPTSRMQTGLDETRIVEPVHEEPQRLFRVGGNLIRAEAAGIAAV